MKKKIYINGKSNQIEQTKHKEQERERVKENHKKW